MSCTALSVAGLAGLTSTAIRTALGTNSCRSQWLRVQLDPEKIDSRQVSARPGEAGDKTKLDRVFADTEDDRDRPGRSVGCKRNKVAAWLDNSHATTHEVSHERGKAIEFTLQPVVLHHYVLALEVAGFVEAFTE